MIHWNIYKIKGKCYKIEGKYYKIEGNTRLRRILQVSGKINRLGEILLDSG